MKIKYVIKVLALAGLATFAVSGQVFSEPAPDTSEPLALRKIMRDLGSSMQVIVGAISRENWDTVEKAASQVADHPRPPKDERLLILSFLGTDAGRFKGYDIKTHDAARILGNVAAEKDGNGVILAFSSLQNTCLACHQSFRKSIQERFHGQQ